MVLRPALPYPAVAYGRQVIAPSPLSLIPWSGRRGAPVGDDSHCAAVRALLHSELARPHRIDTQVHHQGRKPLVVMRQTEPEHEPTGRE